MSWDSYIDNLLGHCKSQDGSPMADKACIIGLEGGAPWTTDGHPNALKLQGDEGVKIAACFRSADFNLFMEKGIYAEGEKYTFLRAEDDRLVLGKQKDNGSLSLQKSKTAIVIAHTIEGGQQGVTNKGVNVIAEYLESLAM